MSEPFKGQMLFGKDAEPFLPVPDTAIRYTFWLPLPPNIANPRRPMTGKLADTKVAYGMAATRKKRYQRDACAIIRSQFGPLPTFQAADYTAHFVLPGRRDLDNLTFLLKFVQDSLREVGMVPNDTERHLRLTAIPTQEVLTVRPRKGESFDQITVRRLAAQRNHRVHLCIWGRA